MNTDTLTESLQGHRNLEVYLEDLRGRLAKARRFCARGGERSDHVAYTQELLQLSEQIRRASAAVRFRSERVRQEDAQF